MPYTVTSRPSVDFWQQGTVRPGGYSYAAKLTQESTVFGIDGGNVEKLTLFNRDGTEIAHYDRGAWEPKPEGEFQEAVVAEIVRFYRQHEAEIGGRFPAADEAEYEAALDRADTFGEADALTRDDSSFEDVSERQEGGADYDAGYDLNDPGREL